MDFDALIAAIAADLGIPAGTVRKWKQRGKVPHHVREDLREAAAQRHVILRKEHFDAFGADRKAA